MQITKTGFMFLCSMYTHAHAHTATTTDTGGLSTDLMVTLGVGIVTLAVVLVSCCAKKHRNNQLQGKQIMYSSAIA